MEETEKKITKRRKSFQESLIKIAEKSKGQRIFNTLRHIYALQDVSQERSEVN